MFSRSHEKPLPPPTVLPLKRKAAPMAEMAGVLLGQRHLLES